MSNFDVTNCTPWTETPGRYACFNIEGQTVLDEYLDATPRVIHGWDFGPTMDITNPNQLFQLAQVDQKKWLIINKKTGEYVSAQRDGERVVPQVGDADYASAHWRIVPAGGGDLFKVYIQSVKYLGSCLTLENGSPNNDTAIKCATQSVSKKGQVWALKKMN